MRAPYNTIVPPVAVALPYCRRIYREKKQHCFGTFVGIDRRVRWSRGALWLAYNLQHISSMKWCYYFCAIIFGANSTAEKVDDQGWALAVPGYQITFPQDHRPHFQFRTGGGILRAI